MNRLERGNNYDAMWLTTNSNACRVPTDDDIIFSTTYDTAELYYKQTDKDSVILYLPWEIDIPNSFPNVIEYEVLHPLEWKDIEKRFESGEIQRVVLDLPESDPCTIRWNGIWDLFPD